MYKFVQFLRIYIQRWENTNIGMFIKNILSASVVFALCCYAVRKDVFITYNATQAALFSILMALIWSGLFNSVGVYAAERQYTEDDLAKALPLSVYITATCLLQVILCAIQSIVCICIFNAFFDYADVGIIFTNVNLDYCITFFLILVSADMFGLAIGTFVSSITTALTVIPIALISQFLFSGALFELDGILESVAGFTTAKFGYSALGSIADLNGEHLPLAISLYYPQIVKAPNALFQNTRAYVSACWGHLVILTLIMVCICVISLYFRINQKK